MAKKDSTEEAGSAAAAFEAEIRANARPMLSEEEAEAEAIKARASNANGLQPSAVTPPQRNWPRPKSTKPCRRADA